MAHNGGSAQTRSNHLNREHNAGRKKGRRRATTRAASFPVFGERQKLEFETSAQAMRIAEHGSLRYLAVNDAAVNLYGYSREEFLQLTLFQTRHPDEHEQLLATFAEPTGYLRYGPPRRQIKKSGEIFLAEIVTQDILYNGRNARLSLTIDVTERKRTEQALRESNAFLRSMIESSPDCIKVLDLDGRLQMMSAGGQRLLQIEDIAPYLNTSWIEFWKGDDRDMARAAVNTTRAGGVARFEGNSPTVKGKPKWWDVILTPIRGANGSPEKLLVVSRDVTKRKQAERALHESESKYRNLVESSTDVIWSTDAAGRITFINEAARGIYGYEPREMLGRSVMELMGDQRRKKPFGFFRTMLAQDRSVADYECELSAKNGQRVILSSNAVVVRDAEGNRIGVTGVSKDITVRKRMEGELRRSEERFRQLAENIRQVFWINSLAGDKVDYVSPGYEEIWGRSRESLFRDPRSWMESIHPEDLPAVQRGQEQMARGEHTEVDYRIIRPDGTTRWINDRSYPMKRSDGTQLVCGIAEDITDRKRAEQDRLTHAILQRDALVREVHHRIKNSLQGIVGLLRRRISKYPAVAHEIEDTIAQLRSVALVYGLQGTRSDGLLPLAEVTDTICSSVESLIGGRVDRTFEKRSQRPSCVAGSEAVSVAVALNELIVNALKHQPAEAGEKHAWVSVREEPDAAEIRIFNRGSLPASFDFGSGRAVGNGLGLVRTLLASPGGNIAFNGGRDGVEVVLTLKRPLLAERNIVHGE